MADKLFLEIVSPEKSLVSSEADEVLAVGTEGEIGILAGHSPYATLLKAGGITYSADGVTKTIVVPGGFLEVSDDRVIVLAEAAEFSTDIDLNEAAALRDEAAEAMKVQSGDDEAMKKAERNFYYQSARFDMAKRDKN